MRKGVVRKLPKYPVETQTLALTEIGIPLKDIYVIGGGATIKDVVKAFRRPGDLYLAADLRVIGSNRKEILGVSDQLESLGVKIHDIAHPEDKSLAKKLERALVKIAEWARWQGSKKDASRIGERGGRAKGVGQEVKRAERAHEDVVRRLCACPDLTWKKRAAILGGKPFSASTLRRRYGKQ